MIVRVNGQPRPQGSKRIVPVKGRGGSGRKVTMRVIEQNKHVGPWKERITETVAKSISNDLEDGTWPKAGPVSLTLFFHLPAPARMPKGRTEPTVRPDLDKLERAVLDALKAAGAYLDDGQVVMLTGC